MAPDDFHLPNLRLTFNLNAMCEHSLSHSASLSDEPVHRSKSQRLAGSPNTAPLSPHTVHSGRELLPLAWSGSGRVGDAVFIEPAMSSLDCCRD